MKRNLIRTLVFWGIIFFTKPGHSQNILTDGDFSSTTFITPLGAPPVPVNTWCSWNDLGTVTSLVTDVSAGVCSYNFTNSGNNSWDVQLVQFGFPLVLGNHYRLSFNVKADADRNFGVYLGENEGSWTNLVAASYVQHAATTWQADTIEFYATSVFPLHKLSFEMGAENIPMYFDNIILESLPANPSVEIIGSSISPYDWSAGADMQTTDGITYTLSDYVLPAGMVKFRQDKDWAVNWGNIAFPYGIASADGSNILVSEGTYNISFNRLTGEYNFACTAVCNIPRIGITGTSVPPYDGSTDVALNTSDGIVYTLNSFSLATGQLSFMEDSKSSIVWGGFGFPKGVGSSFISGLSITSGGTYNISYNRLTGEYNLDCTDCVYSIGIIGSAVPPYDWSAGIDMVTTDNVNYTLLNYPLIAGEVKFRQDNSWAVNWGNSSFPGGTGLQGGPNIPVPAGNYNITFNRLTGEYNFECLLCYCTAGLYNPYNSCTYNSAINDFSLADIQQTATGCGGEFTDFTSLVAHLAQGESYFLKASSSSIEAFYKNYEFLGVWIDLNDNGSFEDEGELLFAPSLSNTFSGIIRIPSDAKLGNHRMRVRLKMNYDLNPFNLNNSCTNFYSGEAQDYTVNIAPAPACPGLSGVAVTDIDLTSAKINWTCDNCSGSYIIEYGQPGFIPGTAETAGSNGTVIAVQDHAAAPVTISNLVSSTGYEVYVRKNCSAEGFSSNFGPVAFTTVYDVCATLTTIDCGVPVNTIIPAGEGVFNNQYSGKEILYQFTPAASGVYTFSILNSNGGSVSYYTKKAADGCNTAGWNAISDFNTYGYPGRSVFDTLEAGTGYFILVDAADKLAGANLSFQIDCFIPSAPCDNIIKANCGEPVTVEVPFGAGEFSELAAYYNYLGKERIVSFTPEKTGPYVLTTYSIDDWNSDGGYSYKKAAEGCNNKGWHFIQNSISPGNRKDLIGTLIAGVEYYILVDAYNVGGVTRTIQIDCIDPAEPCDNIETISCGATVNFSVPAGMGKIVPSNCFTANLSYEMLGKEKMYQFTPDVNGKAAIHLLSSGYTNSNLNSDIRYYFKEASKGCGNAEWQCLNNFGSYGDLSNRPFLEFPYSLTAGVTYYILVDVTGLEGNSQSFEITCPESWDPCSNTITAINCSDAVNVSIPSGIGKYNLVPAEEQFYGSAQGKEVIYSFTPSVSGTHKFTITAAENIYYKRIYYYIKDASSGCNGNGWTKITSASEPTPSYLSTYIPYSLTAGKTYYIMADESNIDGGTQTFSITCPEPTDPCSSITSISCSTAINYSIDAGLGFFGNDPNSFYQRPGKEKIFEYTPSLSGTYLMQVTASSNYYGVSYFIKKAAAGCTNENWQLINAFAWPGSGPIPIDLDAGTSYYILADNNNELYTTEQTFSIVCPAAQYDPCTNIKNIPGCSVPVIAAVESDFGAFVNPSGNTDPYSYTVGKEDIFTFTPTVNGVHGVKLDAGGTGTMYFFIKEASKGCTNTGWTRISASEWGSKMPFALTAGTQYYIMADSYYALDATQSFSIICPSPDPCNDITVVNINNCSWNNPVRVTLPVGLGHYTLTPCNANYSAEGAEKLFSLTPSVSGYHSIAIYNKSTYGNLNLYIKKASDGCNGEGWSCLTDYYGFNENFTVSYPLIQGTTYYIMIVPVASSNELSFDMYSTCANGIDQYLDKDGDGYGDPTQPLYGYFFPKYGYVYDNTDCNDAAPAAYPGATEICGNNIDDDCDGQVDEDCCTITISCPANINQSAGLFCSRIISAGKPVINTGNECTLTKLTWTMSGATIRNSSLAGINYVGTCSFNVGTTTVTYTATGSAGNTVSCNYTVTIADRSAPVIVCPFNITRNAKDNNCSVKINVPNPFFVYDNCGVTKLTWTMTGATTGSSPSSGINYVGTKEFNAGLTAITYTATDAANNTSSCSFNVRVKGSRCCNTNWLPGKSAYGKLDIKVYPNPSDRYFTLEIQSNSNEEMEITVFDATGRFVKKINPGLQRSVRFGDELREGLYLVEVKQGYDREVVKIVKQ